MKIQLCNGVDLVYSTKLLIDYCTRDVGYCKIPCNPAIIGAQYVAQD